jgi:prepilin-type N-terminal cleavage/methylation domain-containing protein
MKRVSPTNAFLYRLDRSARRCAAAFTLVEMLVAVTVLAVIVVLVAQLTSGAAQTVGISTRHMDSDSQARAALGRLGLELAKMLKRSDVDYACFKQPGLEQKGNDQLAFYSETSGYFPGTAVATSTMRSPLSLIAYNIGRDPYSLAMGLRRVGKGLAWEPDVTDGWPAMAYLPVKIRDRWPDILTADSNYQTVGEQVFRIEYTYLLKPNAATSTPARFSNTPWDTTAASPAHTSVDGFRDVLAIVVAVAVLDSSSRVIVKNESYADMADAFPDAAEGCDIAPSWLAVVNAPDFASRAKIPQLAASAVRVYQRTFYLDRL